MARSELAIAIARSDAPLPPPEGIVRVPLTGYVRVATLLGAYLGMLFAPLAFLIPPLSDLSKETRGWLVPLTMILGTGPGVLVTWATARRRSEGRAIAFDATHIWIERRGEFADPLPWTGLRLRGGRIPHLIAEDGRAIPFQREALGSGPDARYLTALVERLPKIEIPPRVPMVVPAAVTIVGFILMLVVPHDRPSLDGDGPFWSPERFRWLAQFVVMVTLLVGGGMWLLVRYTVQSEARTSRSPRPERPGQEIAAYFRTHRFRPPVVSLADGVTYRYREPGFWRGSEKSQREARIALAGMGVLFFAAFTGLALLGRPQPSGPLPLVGIGVFCLIFFVGISLFAPFFSRDAARFRVSGDRIYVTKNEGEPETSFPWPPSRTREPTEPLDWTDELREGKRRLFLDRRLLVADYPPGDPRPTV